MKNLLSHWRTDFSSGIVVFLVAVPLCLGIAVASGAPPLSGIIAGIIGGIVVGAISGSRVGVSGPAAGLASVVLVAIKDFSPKVNEKGLSEEAIEAANAAAAVEGFQIFLLCVVLAGLMQILFGLLKGGFIAYYFPNVVIKGMLAAIGIIIFMKQIPHAVGYDEDPMGDDAFNQVDGHNTWNELLYMWDGITWPAVIISIVSVIILIIWNYNFIKNSFLGKIPGPLMVVGLGIIAPLSLQGTPYELISKHRVNLGVDEVSVEGLTTFPNWSFISDPNVWIVAITIALVASIETLLSVEATDKLDPEKHATPTNRELLAQGTGNTLSGLIGGLPVTQVIVRSTANITSNAKTKMSAIYHGFLILGFVLLLPDVLNLIPMASLAAVLFLVGYKLASPQKFIDSYKNGWLEFIPFVVTIGSIYFTNLLLGIGIGLAVSIFFVLYRNYKAGHYLEKGISSKGDVYIVHLSENMTFLNKASLQETLNNIPENSFVVIDKSRVVSMANDIQELLEDFYTRAKYENIEIEFQERSYISTKINKTTL
jgi:SulP family sulfate permease